MNDQIFYHIGFSKEDLGISPPSIALLSGDPQRAAFKNTILTAIHTVKNLYQ
jgi:uridine phosphorylase